MTRIKNSKISMLVMASALIASSGGAFAQTEMAVAGPAALSTGWAGPGQKVTVKAKVTIKTDIANANVTLSLFNQRTGSWVASKGTNLASVTAGQVLSLEQEFTIPSGTAAGVYRVDATIGANGATHWRDPQIGCFTVSATAPANFGIPVRGCSEIPAGTLRAVGGQIVDSNGTPVRISAINWIDSHGPVGSAMAGLNVKNYKEILKSFRQAGFNSIRIPWSDVNLMARAQSQPYDWSQCNNAGCPGNWWGYIDPVLNPELIDTSVAQPPNASGYTMLKTIDIYKKIAAYAKTIGLRIFFDHHTSQGAPGSQPLWFDKDDATGLNSDTYAPNNGKITYAQFKANTVALAQAFANDSTVIGFELHNEPSLTPSYWALCYEKPYKCSPVLINWGKTNDAYDIKFMAQDVGNAILAVNSRALIILEPPFMNSEGSFNVESGFGPQWAGEGSLTPVSGFGIAPNPVVLNSPNRMVYSIHSYPLDIAGPSAVGSTDPRFVDHSTGFWKRSSELWGAVPAQNLAPVLITEFGGQFRDPPATNAPTVIEWMNSFQSYVNMRNGAYGGPRSFANQTGLGTAYWLAGVQQTFGSTSDPNGNQTEFGNDPNSFIQVVMGYTDGVRFAGVPGETMHNTVIGPGASIRDAGANTWSIIGRKVRVNGVIDNSASNVIAMAYVNGKVYRRLSSGAWSFKTSPTSTWTAVTASPLSASLPGAVATSGSAPIIDSSGNFWYIGGKRVVVNGVADFLTVDVEMLAYVGGKIWQRNANGLWWSKATPSASWLPSAGQSTPPTLTTSADGRSIVGDDGWIVDANKNVYMVVANQLLINGVPEDISSDVVELVYQGGNVWKKNSARQWQFKSSPTATWSAPGATKPARAATAANTYVYPGGNGIIDSTNTSWIISNGQILIDGIRDTTTRDVVRLGYVNGKVWQQNAQGYWWSKGGLWEPWTGTGATTAPF